MTIEIVDLPIENAGSFHSFLYFYQRIYSKNQINKKHMWRMWVLDMLSALNQESARIFSDPK